MMACDGYLPVPTINRERNVRPAITTKSDIDLKTPEMLYTEAQKHRITEFGFSKDFLCFGVSEFLCEAFLTASHKVNDLHFVAIADDGRVVSSLLHNREVQLDRDASRIDLELCEQRRYAQRLLELVRIAVQFDRHRGLLPIVPHG